MNEIADIEDCGIVLYADDTVLYHQYKEVLQDNLDKFAKWFNNNLLTINANKSQ